VSGRPWDSLDFVAASVSEWISIETAWPLAHARSYEKLLQEFDGCG